MALTKHVLDPVMRQHQIIIPLILFFNISLLKPEILLNIEVRETKLQNKHFKSYRQTKHPLEAFIACFFFLEHVTHCTSSVYDLSGI